MTEMNLQVVCTAYLCNDDDEPIAELYISAEEAQDIANGDPPQRVMEFIEETLVGELL